MWDNVQGVIFFVSVLKVDFQDKLYLAPLTTVSAARLNC